MATEQFPSESGPPQPAGDELRPVTALFADIVGSTGLGERLGPDEVKSLVGECVTRMSRAVEEFGGMIQAYMGDGICAYFGVPTAHEDDPERAARAALRILQVVGEYGRDIEEAWGITGFNVRVGINSGPAAVGQVGAATPGTVALGDTTNVAARLQSAAAPGTITVGEATARHLTHRFVLESLGDAAVKGRSEPVATWRLVASSPIAEAPRLTPLVGRESEVERLTSVVGELASGRGQVLMLVGDTGIGKTRLLAELRVLAGNRVVWLEGSCLSYERDLGSWPFVEVLREWLGVAEGDAEVAIRTKLRAKLGALLGGRSEEAIPYLSRLLSLRLEPDVDERLRTMPAESLGVEIRRTYAEWVEALTGQRPVILAVEDTHWAVPTTRALLEELLEVTERAPLLLATTLRPDPSSEGWRFRLRVLTDFAHRSVEVPLGPLPDRAVEQLLSLRMPLGLDDSIRREIAVRAEGNPLYVEEILRALLDNAGVERHRTWTLSITAADLPPALESLLIARIDRLPEEARRLAQVAAVIGRTFSVRLLELVGGPEDLRSTLSVLLRSEIVRETRRYPELECTFRHGLLQEAALSTLTPTRRRDLYGRVGTACEEVFADSLEDHVEALAYYFYRSDDQAKALSYLEQAAANQAALAAGHQAAELWNRAKRLAAKLGDAEAERRIGEGLASIDG
jgi:class 3 adenylate cyclase